MSIEENKAIERRFFEAMNQRSTAAIEQILGANFVDNTPGPGATPDLKGYKQFFATAFTAFPDFHSDIEDMVAEGDKIVTRFTARGTHKGEWAGIAPTGKKITIPGMGLHRIAGGKIVENWAYMDISALMH